MKKIPKTRKDKMGRFNNQVVELVDKSDLTPLETLAVLRMVVGIIEKAFELDTKV